MLFFCILLEAFFGTYFWTKAESKKREDKIGASSFFLKSFLAFKIVIYYSRRASKDCLLRKITAVQRPKLRFNYSDLPTLFPSALLSIVLNRFEAR
jgi:hypothetical protein